MSSRVAMRGRDHHLVVPMAEWMPTAHEAPHPNAPLSSHVENHSKTTRKPRRSSPLAGPALSNDRSVVSLNETPDAPRTRSSLFISQDANRILSTRPKSSSGLSRPTSIVAINRPLPSQSPPRYSYSSRHRPSTAPTPSSKSLQGDIRTIGRPPSTLFPPNEPIRSERVFLSTSQGSRGVVSGSSFVGDNSGSRSRASHIPTASAGSSTRPVSVVLEVETEEEDGGEDDAAPSRTSGMLYPKSIPNPVAVAPVDNSWYVANEYSETPKFSRLGLAGSNVVMPVSAKELRKQLSRPGSSASLRSNMSGGFPGKGGSEWTGSPANGAGMSLANSSSSSMTSSKEQSGMIKSSSSSISRDDPGSDGSPQKEHTTSRTHNKPEWLRPPQTYTRPRRAGMRSLSPSISSLPSPSPIFNSAASSASSLPLPTPPYSGMSSTPSVISCATAHTSVDDIQETIQEYKCQHCPKDTPPITLEKKLVKRKSVLAMMKSWRRTPQSAQRSKHLSSDLGLPLNDSNDEHGVLSVSSGPESSQSVEKEPGVVVYIEPSKAHNVKKVSADVLVTSVPQSRSESTIQDIPGSGKRDKRVGSVRKIWNALTGRTSKP